ncbi:hypothetical protein VT50_0234475 [Streptomyces antioxidans]|uniref:Uncharacterized protein n=1 Tax=Streptomyces antioxidans TaxID=1507734 RepID=A0A1V4CVP2_9ACTN|nr:hypothetical protein [Streptomyces antioxidans]OPF71367.1 hypothetical protein VT50_0234475 [Streptomyces antioxidans]
MSDERRAEEREEQGVVPRDLPDQQAQSGPDHLDVAGAGDEPDEVDDVPETDESGTGRQGRPQTGSVHPEQPVPDEPSG